MIRPVSKVCYLITEQYVNKKNQDLVLNQEQINKIIEANFEWLIGDHKVAAQAFAMDTLFIWGYKLSWIHPELTEILQTNSIHGSKGYQARARKILKILIPDDD